MTDVNGQPETERQADYFTQPWMHEAVGRYFYSKVKNRRFCFCNGWLVKFLFSGSTETRRA